jgi:hypothetical protein
MIINGVNSSSGTLYQTVTVPSGCSNLTFWLNITTSEAQGAAIFDRLFIEVRSTTGTLLATLATFSNQNSGTAGNYILRGPYNLSSFSGQTVRIQFRGTNDITLPTSFRIDDVAVQQTLWSAPTSRHLGRRTSKSSFYSMSLRACFARAAPIAVVTSFTSSGGGSTAGIPRFWIHNSRVQPAVW